MLSKFFIDRPVLAWVVAIMTILFGLIILPRLEIARFPNIAPPSVRVSMQYPGASADTLETSIAQVVEQQMTGLDNLLYFSSQSSSEGTINLSFSFDPSVDPDIAQMQIQNRLNSIMSKLPESVQKNGARIRKVSDDTLQRIAFYAEDGSMSQEDVADFVSSVVQDPISRVNGVGNVDLNGSAYAIRIWLDLQKLFAYKLNPQDIVDAITAQNKQISVGQLGGLPNVDGQKINVSIQSRRLLEKLGDFEHILVKVEENGAAVYLKDVAKVEMGRENYTFFGNYNSRPMASLAIDLTEGANAVDTAERVAAKLEELRPLFPAKLTYSYAYDTVPFVKASLYEVSKTLLEALILVSAVILLFLRDLRATFIVSLTVPIVLAGTLVVLYALGYSINTLSMFAMVLSIGLLVDDAIVVVENINRLIHEENLSPYQAAVRSMSEISSALFGVGLVIAAVFTPMSFFSGASGNIYRQFSVTIVSSMLLSIIVAIIITPSLCAQFLKGKKASTRRSGLKHLEKSSPLSCCINAFDLLFSALKSAYIKIVRCSLNQRLITLFGLVLLSLAACFLFFKIPSSFLPVEDQGIILARIVLPPGSTQDMTKKVATDVEEYFIIEEKDNLNGIMLTLGSAGGATRGQATAQASIMLKSWDERKGLESSAERILMRAKRHFDNNPDAKINFYLPSSVRGMGSSSGFLVNVQNVMGNDHELFMQDIQEIVNTANSSPKLYNVRYDVLDDTLQMLININDLKAGQFGVSPDTINSNLEIAWGGKYVNDFNDRGRIKKVYVQADAQYRSLPSDLGRLYFRNESGQMVDFDSIGTYDWMFGPMQLQRFNGVSAITVVGEPAAGVSSGEAMQEIARIIRMHPGNYGYAWAGISFQEQLTGSQIHILFLFSALVVFLCLAALYESWNIPLCVILIVPIGAFGALLATFVRGIPNDIYLQVALLTTGALAAKNAVLIIEYAHQFRLKGRSLINSAKKAAAMRFRPIVMTSVAFLIGVLPLFTASGAGAVSQQSIGTGVIGGTLAATSLGIIMVPTFFVAISLLFDWKLLKRIFKHNKKN